MRPSQEKPPGTHTHHEYVPPSAAKDDQAASGYIEREYEHQEYPKWIGDVLVKSAEEEKALSAEPAKPAKSKYTLKDIE
jgi:hypothetical protein